MRIPGVGDVVAGNKYRIVRILGRGGMGVVFEATQLDLGRAVALKVFSLEVADDALLARFRREVSILARISHPHIVPVFDFSLGDAGTPPFLAMELLQGRTLGELTTSLGRLDATRATRIAMQLLEALAAAHAQGVLHRDVKPANVFCVQTQLAGDFVKLLDFGVAKDLGAAPLTQAGDIVGTLTYLAPEVLRGEAPTYQSDVYAVGATLYYALSGKSPFSRSSSVEVAQAILSGDVAPIERLRPDTPSALAKVVARALDVRSEERFASAAAMHEALAATLAPSSDKVLGPPAEPTLVSGAPPTKKKTKTALAIVLAVVAFGVGGVGVVVFQRSMMRKPTTASSALAPASTSAFTPASAAPSAIDTTRAAVAATTSPSATMKPVAPVRRLAYSGKFGYVAALNGEQCGEIDFDSFRARVRDLPWAKCFANAMFDPPLHQFTQYDVLVTGDRVTRVTSADVLHTPSLDTCVESVARTLSVPRPASAGACHIKVGLNAECSQYTIDGRDTACR